jgi:hypothetical protein
LYRWASLDERSGPNQTSELTGNYLTDDDGDIIYTDSGETITD